MKLILILLLSLSYSILADCRGCCSGHKGVICNSAITVCRDGSSLSQKCQAKSCNKCEGKSSYRILTKTKNQSLAYDRKLYPHWIDEDGDCQNSRAEYLIKNNKGKIKFKRNKACNVSWGSWYDPYSGKTFHKASDLDLDHIVPLKHAHDNGANTWTRKKRRAFANDPLNLLAVDKSLNRQKGAKGPLKWMPPRKEYHCEYLKRWNLIKEKYGLIKAKREIASLRIKCSR